MSIPQPGDVAIATVPVGGFPPEVSARSAELVVWTDSTNGACWFVPAFGIMLPESEVTVTSRAVVITAPGLAELIELVITDVGVDDEARCAARLNAWFAARLGGG